jgi:hypothetical protein
MKKILAYAYISFIVGIWLGIAIYALSYLGLLQMFGIMVGGLLFAGGSVWLFHWAMREIGWE